MNNDTTDPEMPDGPVYGRRSHHLQDPKLIYGMTLCLRCYDTEKSACECPSGTIPKCPRCHEPPCEGLRFTNGDTRISCGCASFKCSGENDRRNAIREWRDIVFSRPA